MSGATKQKIVKGAMWAGAGRLLSMPAGLLSTLLLARAATPADNGAYFVALSIVTILTGVGAIGMDQVVIRFAATFAAQGNRSALRQVIWRCFGISLACASVLALIFSVAGSAIVRSALGMPILANYTAIIAAWLFFALLQLQLAETFRGLNDIRMATLAGGVRSGGILNTLVVCGATLALWAMGKLTLLSALWTMLGTSIVVVLFSIVVLRRRLRGGEAAAPLDPKQGLTVGAALREGWPLGLAGIVVVLNNTGTAWLASPLDTANHVALYGVAQRFVQLVLTPMVVINAVLPPIVAELHATARPERLEHVIRSIAGMILMLSLAIVSVLVVGGRPLLQLMFGSYYVAAYPLLLILCAGHLANIGTGAWQIVLSMTGNKHRLLASSAIAVVVQLLLGLGLGLHYGVTGVAIGYAAGIICTNIVGTIVVHRKLGIWTHASFKLKNLRDGIEMIRAPLARRFSLQKRGSPSDVR